MTILNIGGTGFIGAELTARLEDHGEDVVCFDIDPGTHRDLDATVVEGDVTDYDAVATAIDEHQPSRVIHLAYILTATAEKQPNAAVAVNCCGTDNVLHAAGEAGVDRVVYASSIAAYGWPDEYEGTIHEDVDIRAAAQQFPGMYLYGATKQFNEYQGNRYAREYDMDVIGVRPSIVFGPGRESGLSAWASGFVSDPARGAPGHIPCTPDQPLSMVYRDDVAELFAILTTASDVEWNVYNTGGHTVTTEELVELVEREIGGEVSMDPDANRLGLVADVSHDRARDEFGYELTPLATAVRDHAAHVE